MKLNWINIFGGVLVLLLLIPNIIRAIKSRGHGESRARLPLYLTLLEQIGRYGCMILMVLPLFVGEFGFGSVELFFIYLGANAVLLIGYDVGWIFYSRKKRRTAALALAIIPTLIFIVSGCLLSHWALVVFAVLFGISHGAITVMSHKNAE